MNANQRASRRQEKRITRNLKEIIEDTHQTINSGSVWVSKSDVVNSILRVECKTKIKPSTQITLKKEWFEKILLEAFESNLIGTVAFSFGDGVDYYTLRDKDLISLLEELIELRKRVEGYENTDNRV